jgi:hypothetical protein
MKLIVEVLHSTSAALLQDMIALYVEDGWQLSGEQWTSQTVYKAPYDVAYHQRMVKQVTK